MIDNKKVEELVTEALAGEGAFLVDMTIGSDHKIRVLADHPAGITLEQLANISRYVEGELDREEMDFAIEVSSPGVGAPLLVREQYVKNVGRAVKVILQDGTVKKGDFTAFEEDTLTVRWEEREPKPVGKGKITVVKEEKIPLSDIKETIVEIKF